MARERSGHGLSLPPNWTDVQKRPAEGFRARNRYSRAFKGFAGRLSDRQVERLSADPAVAAVVPDRVVRAAGSVPLRSGESARRPAR